VLLLLGAVLLLLGAVLLLLNFRSQFDGGPAAPRVSG
jgi:hypothetical protein